MKISYCIFIFFIISTNLFSTIINIPADQPTIQAGINSAVNSDTVLVQPGIYVENINYNGKNITVASLFLTTQDTTYISQTIIDGNQNDSVVIFENGENSIAVLIGFTITNGDAFYGNGGGIYCIDYSSPSLKNVTISGNSANDSGGGVYCNNSSSPNLENVTITDNSADYHGGGIYLRSNSSPSLQNVTISDNFADDDGGGIHCMFSSPSLVNVTLTGNFVTGYSYGSCNGGGIYCIYSNPNLENVTITSNSAYNGGGFYCCANSIPTLENVIIESNTAYKSGGGIYCSYNSNPILENVTIRDNYADDNGGGIYFKGNSIPSFNMENRCNIYQNHVINSRGFGVDIYAFECDTISVIVDTFTVMTPTDYYASPIDNFNFNILCGIQDSLINSDLFVSVNGNDSNSGISAEEPLRTIKYALSKIYTDSLNHNTIFLLPGIYCSDTNGEEFPIEWSNYVSLEGIVEEETILDANNSSGIMRFNYINEGTIKNIIIRNGSAHHGGGIYCYYSNLSFEKITLINNSATEGGGIYCSYSNPSLENVTLTGNSADYGGGIYCEDDSNPILENIAISGNSGDSGGGIYCDNSSPSLINITIIDNSSYSGGGIYCNNNSCPSLESVTIVGNSANDEGGGIYCCDNSHPGLINVVIIDNSATYCGGGIYCDNSNSNLQNVTISGNSVSGTNGKGGGIYCRENANPSLENVAITYNSTSFWGGGIYCYESNPNLKNVTITGNSALLNGGGIYCSLYSDPSFINCIIWNDFPQEIYIESGSVTVSYSDIQGDWTGEGNIDEDPLFVGTGEDPYSLLEDSPCIDAGIPDTTGLNLPPWDIIGNLRIWDGDGNGSAIIDMGAYEYGAPPYVDIDDNVVVQTPEVFLHQNYPNPFNPSTTISFNLTAKNAKDAKLTIYNLKGQKVRKYSIYNNQSVSAGLKSSINWNGTDENNKPVGTGIYFYQLKAGDFQQVRKMILLK